ncbi:MAG: CoA-binding protein [Nitriliruptor sp.]|uniref:CoA-binding protein n=1 Tax=Nitriliruptor sp. TaxID=2448056 RepID=UPI00349FFDA2
MRADQRAVIRSVLSESRRIAVVGASQDPGRPSHGVIRRLLDMGYAIVPVNPNASRIHGLDVHPSLEDVGGPVDIVDVFRRSEHAPEVATAAVAAGAKALWLQQGVRSDEARAIAEDAGLLYVEDACLAVEAERAGIPLPPPA